MATETTESVVDLPLPDEMPTQQPEVAQADKDTGAEAPAEPDTTEDAGTSDDGDDQAADDAKPKGKGGFQNRIDKLTRQKADAEREIEFWKRQALGKDGEKPAAPKEPAPAKATDAKPQPGDYSSWEEYEDAAFEWRLAQREKRLEAARGRETQQVEARAAHEKFWTDAAKLADVYPDFEAVVRNDELQISAPVAQMIMQSDKAHDLAYHVAANPALALELSRMAPVEAARKLGRIEATLSRPAPRTVTQAPPPAARLKGGDVPAKDPEKMSMDEYRAWRERKRA